MEENNELQVWQRVLGQRKQENAALRPLVLSSLEAAAAYRHLAAVLPGPAGELAKQLLAGEQQTLAALKGIAWLSGQGRQREKMLPPMGDTPEQLLKKVFHRAGTMAAEYTARSAQGDVGLVFAALAKREGEHCVLIARMLGSL